MSKRIGDPSPDTKFASSSRSPHQNGSGLVLVEMIIVVGLLLVGIVLLVRAYGGFSNPDSPTSRMTHVSTIETSMRLLDSYRYITGEKYAPAVIDSILQQRVDKTEALLTVNLPPSQVLPIVGAVYECASTGCSTDPISVACSDPAPGACPAGAALAPLRVEVYEYAQYLSTLSDFKGKATLMFEIQCPVVDGEADVSQCSQGATPDGGSTPTEPPPTASPGPAQCIDGADNDGDGLTDYPLDPECASFADTNEAS